MATGGPDDAAAGVDLFNRWQAHHAGTSVPAEAAREPAPPRHAREVSESTPPVDAATGEVAPGPAPVGDTVVAGREDVEAVEVRGPAPVEPTVVASVRHRRETATPPPAGVSTDVVFAPRLLVRRLVGVLALVALAGAAYTGYLAYDAHTTLRLGGCGVLVVLALVLWGIRAGAPVTRLEIRSGRLEVRRGSLRQVVDLNSRYTPVQMVGRPGRRGWKILLARLDQAPVVIDSTMVDPRAFTDAVRRYRPDLGA